MSRNRRTRPTTPDWANEIRSLRKTLNLSQVELGKRLNVSAMTCSRWERGMQAPPTDCYLELARLAGPSRGWYFWTMAGLRKTDVQIMTGQMKGTKDPRIADVIAALEGQAALSEAQSRRIATSLSSLPTVALRREYKAMSDTDAQWAKLMRQQAEVLREIYSRRRCQLGTK